MEAQQVRATIEEVFARRLSHPFVVHLLAVVLAVAGAGGAGARAPQALRAWMDTAAEVAGAGRRPAQAAPDQTAPSPVERADDLLAGAPPPPPSSLPVTRPGHAWPSAGDLRQLLALKHARLI